MSADKLLPVYLSGGHIVHLLPSCDGMATSRAAVCGRVPKQRGMFRGQWLKAGESVADGRRCKKCFPAAPTNPKE